MTTTVDLSRLVTWTDVEPGRRYRVGSGTVRQGQSGMQIGVVALKHGRDFNVVLQLDNGSIESFSPMQLFPEILA